MDLTNSLILPHILETLSQKQDLRDSVDNLCVDIEKKLAMDNHNGRITNLRKAIHDALNIGERLGIFSLTDEIVRVPFHFSMTGKRMDYVNDVVEKDQVISVRKNPMDRDRRRSKLTRKIGSRGGRKQMRSRTRRVNRRRR